jgi:hypothetical protein
VFFILFFEMEEDSRIQKLEENTCSLSEKVLELKREIQILKSEVNKMKSECAYRAWCTWLNHPLRNKEFALWLEKKVKTCQINSFEENSREPLVLLCYEDGKEFVRYDSVDRNIQVLWDTNKTVDTLTMRFYLDILYMGLSKGVACSCEKEHMNQLLEEAKHKTDFVASWYHNTIENLYKVSTIEEYTRIQHWNTENHDLNDMPILIKYCFHKGIVRDKDLDYIKNTFGLVDVTEEERRKRSRV